MTTLFVPGRLCLFGEHSDWAGALRTVDPAITPGACIVTGTDQGITATAEPAIDFEITSPLPDGRTDTLRLPMSIDTLRRGAATANFFSYATGVAAAVASRYHPSGVRLVVTHVDLPIAKGLSSSAAISVLVARAFNEVHHLGLSIRDEMELAYQGEIDAGSQCGRMDQACAYGQRPVLLRFDGDAMDVELLRPGQILHLLIVELGCAKNTRRILSELRRSFLSVNRTHALREALGQQNQQIIARARQALETGDAAQIGTLMLEAQALFDACIAPACSSELAAPRLHAVLAHPAARELAWGGKGVGSQGDGAAQFACRGAEERERFARELMRDCEVHCLPLTITPPQDELRVQI